MPAIPLRAMVLCANPGRLLRYGALFNRCGYFHLSLCLDRRELRRSLDQGYPYDYFLYDGFRLDQGCKGTLAMLGRSGSIRRFLLVGELDCREKRLLFEQRPWPEHRRGVRPAFGPGRPGRVDQA